MKMLLSVDGGDNNHKQDDNNVHGYKRLSSSGDGKENLPMCIEGSVVSEGLPQVKKRRAKGYNLRKSIAWNKAFSTEEGILDEYELCFFNGKFNHSVNDHLLSSKKINGSCGNILGSPNLETLQEELLEQSDKQNGESSVSNKPLSLAPKKVSHSPASKENFVTGKTSQLGVCPRPPASKSLIAQVHAKRVPSVPSTSKSRLGLSVSLKKSTTDKKQFKVMEKNTTSKLSAGRTFIDTRRPEPAWKKIADIGSRVSPAVTKIHVEKNNPKKIATGGAVSVEKNKKPTLISQPRLDAQKASHKVVQCCNHKNEKVIHPIPMPISHSDPVTNNVESLHGEKANIASDLPPLGKSQSLHKNQDAVKTGSLPNIALLACPTTLPRHSNVGIPNHQPGIKPSDRKFLPTSCPKPSGLRMPSPARGFFHQVKTSDALVQAHKSSLVPNIGSHVCAPGKANCPPEISKLDHGWTPSEGKCRGDIASEKGIRPVSEFVGSPVTLMLASTISEPPTTTVSTSSICQERLKLDTSLGVMGEINGVTDYDILLISGTPCDISVLSERNPGDIRSVERNVTDEKDRQESPRGSFNCITLMTSHGEVNIQNDVSSLERLDGKNGRNDTDSNTWHVGAPTSGGSQVAYVGGQVLEEIIGLGHVKHNSEYLTQEAPVSSKSVVSDLEFPETVDQAFGSEEQIEADTHDADEMNQGSKDPSFYDLSMDDSCSVSERKRMRTSSDLRPNACVEENIEVPATVIDSFDSRQYTEGLCAQTTDGDQRQLCGIVNVQDESTSQQAVNEIKCSSSFRELSVTSCASLLGPLPVSEDTIVIGNDDSMKINGEKTFDLDGDCVMNICNKPGKTCLEEGRMNLRQDTISLLDSSSSLSAEEENDPSLASSILLESVCDNHTTNRLASFGDELHLNVGLDVLDDEKLSVESAAVTTREGIQEIATCVPKGDSRVADLIVQHEHDIENGARSAESEDTMIPKNLSQYSKEELISMNHSLNLAPFSEEWIAALESAGEDVLKRKTGAVQHSPPDKTLSEPDPWSPVKKSQDIGPFDCTKYTRPAGNSD